MPKHKRFQSKMKKIKLSKSNKFIISLIAISFICFFFTAKASLAEITVGTDYNLNENTEVVPHVYNIDLTSCANSLLLVDAGVYGSFHITGVSWNNIFFSPLIDEDHQSNFNHRIFYLIDPEPGTYNLEVYMDTSGQGVIGKLIQFCNVDPFYPFALIDIPNSEFQYGNWPGSYPRTELTASYYATSGQLFYIDNYGYTSYPETIFTVNSPADLLSISTSSSFVVASSYIVATSTGWISQTWHANTNVELVTGKIIINPSAIQPENPRIFFDLPFNFKLGNVSCCENEDCNIPIQALNTNSDQASIGLYNNDNSCENGNSSYLAVINHYQWYRDPYDPLNQLIIPSSSLQSMGSYRYCLAGQFQKSGTTKSYQSGGHTFTVYASTSEMCLGPTALSFCDDPCSGIATSSIGGQIDCGYKKFVCWLTVPSEKSHDKMQNNLELLKLKFPFSAFTQISNSIVNTIGSTTDDMTGSLSLPMYNGSSFYLVKIADSSTIPLAIGSENANTFKNTLIDLFWILGGLYILLRINIKFEK